MGPLAARKCYRILENSEQILGIELLVACQGLDFRAPLVPSPALAAVHGLVRSVVPTLDSDRVLHPDLEAAAQLVRGGRLIETARPFLSS